MCLRGVAERLGENRDWGGLCQFIEGAQTRFESGQNWTQVAAEMRRCYVPAGRIAAKYPGRIAMCCGLAVVAACGQRADGFIERWREINRQPARSMVTVSAVIAI